MRRSSASHRAQRPLPCDKAWIARCRPEGVLYNGPGVLAYRSLLLSVGLSPATHFGRSDVCVPVGPSPRTTREERRLLPRTSENPMVYGRRRRSSWITWAAKRTEDRRVLRQIAAGRAEGGSLRGELNHSNRKSRLAETTKEEKTSRKRGAEDGVATSVTAPKVAHCQRRKDHIGRREGHCVGEWHGGKLEAEESEEERTVETSTASTEQASRCVGPHKDFGAPGSPVPRQGEGFVGEFGVAWQMEERSVEESTSAAILWPGLSRSESARPPVAVPCRIRTAVCWGVSIAGDLLRPFFLGRQRVRRGETHPAVASDV